MKRTLYTKHLFICPICHKAKCSFFSYLVDYICDHNQPSCEVSGYGEDKECIFARMGSLECECAQNDACECTIEDHKHKIYELQWLIIYGEHINFRYRSTQLELIEYVLWQYENTLHGITGNTDNE